MKKHCGTAVRQGKYAANVGPSPIVRADVVRATRGCRFYGNRRSVFILLSVFLDNDVDGVAGASRKAACKTLRQMRKK
ncbi:hypothetical protein [Streptomyces sp. NPDC014676]|uniref:hypothetical protein n=1 Tax=Streptomyces sp. NPDC014676 TaxID=3364879 RepID=UPI0036F9BF30